MPIEKPPTGRKCEKKDGSCWVPEMLTNLVFGQRATG